MEFEGGNKASVNRRKSDSLPDAKVKKKGKKKRAKPAAPDVKPSATGPLNLKPTKYADDSMTNINYESDGEKNKQAHLSGSVNGRLKRGDQKPMLVSGLKYNAAAAPSSAITVIPGNDLFTNYGIQHITNTAELKTRSEKDAVITAKRKAR